MNEADLQTTVTEMLTMFSWRWCHFRSARTEKGWRTAISGHPGFPDIVALRVPRLLFIELKGDKGQTSEDQRAWLEALSRVLCEVHLWRPTDLSSGEIERVLR